ncbi:hypothetical protein HMPREF2953_01895 [Staphylococcus sp. HMSC072E01]|uniref:CapA family protein n=1 Tax=Staphylococcus sp. HMSC072E01 TaxID=1739457 RepID=UPI0008A2EEA4|nr:CapA family protein [Staphylococcus sp. HMSC072E01]OFQ11238.1 hypothetical protein HMPREF2953_01895 [Staphylococcus sp. HMSC072E01]
MVFDKKRIEEILEGDWYVSPKEDWAVDNVVASYAQAREDYRSHHQSLFVAIDNDTWKSHVKDNSEWHDTHSIVSHASQYISGVVVKTPIPQLDVSIPQFIVDDPYEALDKLAHSAYDTADATLIATTGTNKNDLVTINTLLNELLTKGEHISLIKQYDHPYINLLTALASSSEETEYIISNAYYQVLTSNLKQFEKYIPDISIISSIEQTETKNLNSVIEHYTQLIKPMFVDSTVIMNSDSEGFESLHKSIEDLKLNFISYGFIPNSDVFVLRNKKFGEFEQVKANILGENIDFQIKIHGIEKIKQVLSVLTTLKVLHIPLYTIIHDLKEFIPVEDRHQATQHHTYKGDIYEIVNSNNEPTMDGMREALKELNNQKVYFKGKTIAIIGHLFGITEENKEGQYRALAEEIRQSNIDLVIGYGKDTVYCLRHLPTTQVIGYYHSVDQLVHTVAVILENEDSLLIKGSNESEEWKALQDKIIEVAATKPIGFKTIKDILPPSEGYGSAVFNMRTGEKVAQYGNQYVTQNQGVGNLLVIHRILNLLFSKKLHRSQTFKPDTQSLNMNNKKHAIPLENDDEIQLEDILSAALVSNAPNASMMLANRVLGSSENSLNMMKVMVKALGLNSNIAENITGLPIEGKKQKLTLGNLFLIGKLLFTNYPVVRDILSISSYTFKNSTYKMRSNLYDYGLITHGLFYGVNDSIGIVRSKFKGETYITVVLGARNAFHRDAIIYRTLSNALNNENKKLRIENIRKVKQEAYKINILGDTYFEELSNVPMPETALQSSSSRFEKIRPLLDKGDFNICMLDTPMFDIENTYLEQRVHNIRRSNEVGTLEILKQENIDLISLASPHLMDSDEEGLNRTLELLEEHDIYNIGAGYNQQNAEKPFVIYVNHQRYMIFNTYYYQSENYYAFNRYAIGEEKGIACLNPFIYEQISVAKREDPKTKVIVIAHWGKKQQDSTQDITMYQRLQAQRLSVAGADIIIGHGNYHMQGIEQMNATTVLYDIGVGIFGNEADERSMNDFPYSFIPQINIQPNHTMCLKLYPIYHDNSETRWQPRCVSEEELEHCFTLLKTLGLSSNLIKDKDEHFYFEIPI